MRYLIGLVLIVALSGCGKPELRCEVKDACTGAVGSECHTQTVKTVQSCGSYSEDWQKDPTCDPANPNQTCGGTSWSGPAYACCHDVQGPGKPCTTAKCDL